MARRYATAVLMTFGSSCVPSHAQDLKVGNTVWAVRDTVSCKTVADTNHTLKFERADKRSGTRFDFPKQVVGMFDADRCRVTPGGQKATVRRTQADIVCIQEDGDVDCLWTGREYVSRKKPSE